MEKTYTKQILMDDGNINDVTFRHLTARDVLKIMDNTALLGNEGLMDLVSPGLLDTIAISQVFDTIEFIQESDKDFFFLVAQEVKRLTEQAEHNSQTKSEEDTLPTS